MKVLVCIFFSLLLCSYANAQSQNTGANAKPHPKDPHHTTTQHNAKQPSNPNAQHTHTTTTGQQDKNYHQSKKEYHKVSDVVTDQKHHKGSSSSGTSKKSGAAKHKKKQIAALKHRNQKNDGVFEMY